MKHKDLDAIQDVISWGFWRWESTPSPYGNPELALIERQTPTPLSSIYERREEVTTLLARLQPRDRIIVTLSGDNTEKAIGVIIGVSQPSIHHRFLRLRDWVRFVLTHSRTLNAIPPPKSEVKCHMWNAIICDHTHLADYARNLKISTSTAATRWQAITDEIVKARDCPQERAIVRYLRTHSRQWATPRTRLQTQQQQRVTSTRRQ